MLEFGVAVFDVTIHLSSSKYDFLLSLPPAPGPPYPLHYGNQHAGPDPAHLGERNI